MTSPGNPLKRRASRSPDSPQTRARPREAPGSETHTPHPTYSQRYVESSGRPSDPCAGGRPTPVSRASSTVTTRCHTVVLPSPAPSEEARSPALISVQHSPTRPQTLPHPPPVLAIPEAARPSPTTQAHLPQPLASTEAHQSAETAEPNNIDPNQQATNRTEELLAKLHQYADSRAGRQTPAEHQRFYRLQQALISHDEFFLLTNELLVLWLFNPRKCAGLLGLPLELVDKACAEFDYFLGPVRGYGDEVLAWVVDFPLGLQSIDVPEISVDLMKSVSALFSLLGRESPSPIHKHVAKWGIPLRHRELLGDLHILSPTLCAGFWHCSRVLLGVHDIPANAKIIAAMDQKFGEDRDFHTSQTHSAEEHDRHDVELEAAYRALLSVAVIGQGQGDSQTVSSPRDGPVVQAQAQVNQQRHPIAPNGHGQLPQQAHPHQHQAHQQQAQLQHEKYILWQQTQTYQQTQQQSMQQAQHQARKSTLQQLMQQPLQQAQLYLQKLYQQYPQRAQELERLLHQNGYFQQQRTSQHAQQPVLRTQPQFQTQMQHPHQTQPQQQLQPSTRVPSSPYVSPSSLLEPGQLGAAYGDGRNPQTHARISSSVLPGEPGGASPQPVLTSPQISQVRVGNTRSTAVNLTSDPRAPTMNNSPTVRVSSVKSRVRTTLPQQHLPRHSLPSSRRGPLDSGGPGRHQTLPQPFLDMEFAPILSNAPDAVNLPIRHPGAEPSERYYRYVDSLLAGPVPLKPDSALVKFEFDISESDFKERAQVGVARGGGLPGYSYFEGCRRVYFRVSAMPIRAMRDDSTIAENKWVTAPTVWPEVLTAKVNEDGFVEFARKREFGRNHPCEITAHLRVGRNVVSVGVMLPPPEGYCFYGAVELVYTASQSSIMKTSLTQRVSAETDTVDIIKSRLSMSLGDDDDDDEIQIIDPEVCINLTDPYSGTLVEVPCRGEACAHLDVFDLRTLLETRPVKQSCAHGARVREGCPECVARPSERQELSLSDVWGCPICNEDVRPGHVVVDGFLKGVVREMRREGGDSKVVFVDAEGKWRVKTGAKKAVERKESIMICD